MGNKLTDTMIKNYKPKDKAYKVFDGQGLFLQIKPNGSKLWRLKYRFKEKEKLFAIGKYPEVTLAEARKERDEARKMIFGMNPQDPLEVKKEKIRESDQEEKKKNLYTLGKKLGSDVNYILFEIFPRLNKGVIIHIHDIPYPFEYRKDFLHGMDAY